MSQKVRAPDFDRIFIKKLCSTQSSGVFLCGWILLAYVASLGLNPFFSRRGIHWDTSCGTVLYSTANDPQPQMIPRPQMIPKMDRKWPSTASDPQSRPQMIPKEK